MKNCMPRIVGALTAERLSYAGAALAMSAFAFASTAFADAIYSAAPDDVSQIVVSNGTTTTALGLCRDHLTQHWTFDNADNMYSDSVGDVTISAMGGSTVTRITGEDAKVGDGAVSMTKGIQASRNVFDGKSPFTISFWLKKSTWSGNQHTMLFIGDKTADGENHNHIRLSYGNVSGSTDNGYGKLYLWENNLSGKYSAGNFNSNLGTADRWNHVALTCRVVEQEGAATSNKYVVALNGVSYTSITVAQNDFTESQYLLFGYGWHPDGVARYGNISFDEIMIFDKALSIREVAAIRDLTQPTEFSANWHMTAGSGTLDIHGGSAQKVTGYGGTVTTDAGLVLAPDRNATYAGVVSGASLTLDAASSSVTQTIAGANSYVGDTHVKTGVLAVNPMALFPTLETTLVAYWPCDTFSMGGMIADMSANGNHLYPNVGVGDLSVDDGNCIVDGALYFPRTGDEINGFKSEKRLKGFANEDNSFTVSLWVRVDAVIYREGFFTFGTSNGIRLNGSGSALYFGDRYNSKIVTTYRLPSSEGFFGDGKWRHFAVAYDKTKANETDNCYFLYLNGSLVQSSPKFDSCLHATDPFNLGLGILTDQGSLKGALDDVVVLNGVSATDIAALYNWRRGAHEADGETSVLPDTTRVVVDAGATLFITNANESVRSIAGAGTIHIAEGSSLFARSRKDFTGTIVGGGIFRCPGLSMVIR